MRIKTVSGLKKCFLDEDINEKEQYLSGSCLKNECYHYEVIFDCENAIYGRLMAKVKVVSPLESCISIRVLEHVPVQLAAYGTVKDEHYLRTTPGLYPDILEDFDLNAPLSVTQNLRTLYIEVSPDGKYPAGEYPIKIEFYDFNNPEVLWGESNFTLEIIDALLPKQDTFYSQWLYCDCLQDYYETDSFDERHWQIIENFMRTAVKRGINMMLTPIFTPPLDTYVGGERTTTQLVDVTLENGRYSFGFDKLKRWIELCDKVGVKYLEFAHLYTQWGAKSAPKIMATVDGEVKRIFGWETDASGKEYTDFLHEFLTELLKFIKSTGIDKERCFFHISDEPHGEEGINRYIEMKKSIEDVLDGYHITDAMSNYELYERGAMDIPIPATNRTAPFLENKVKGLWTYYCCSQSKDLSNKFIAMPLSRTRILGVQMYRLNINGFLNWGYNYYNNQYSYGMVNPYLFTDGDYFSPSGDAASVYPGRKGQPIESVRLTALHEAFQDIRALKLCESLIGREETIRLLGEGADMTFEKYPRDDDYILDMRKRVNEVIKKSFAKM